MNLIEWPYYREEYLAGQGFSKTFLHRFWSKVQITEGCWIWISGLSPDGYGKIWDGFYKAPGKPRGFLRAHRASWIIHYGPIPPGQQVLHDCPDGDNPRCIRPHHLWLGTNLENMADGVEKGQFPRGEASHRHKLTWENVCEIRQMWETGRYSQQALADRFDVPQTNISLIVRHKAWIRPPRLRF